VGLYKDVVLPRFCHLAMRNRRLLPYRKRTVSRAEGRVLEIGVGSGLNLPFYRAPVRELLALEPSPRLLAMARRLAAKSPFPISLISFIEGSAEAIPIEGKSVDTVVSTWTLCTIPETAAALGEIRRVLRPGGRLVFTEHGLAPEDRVRKWQDRLEPAWERLSGGCHLNRPIRDLIESNGFRVDRVDLGYMPGPKPMTFIYEGSARPN
jgi:ubiquinone/menaquinone biosynthesis C-methylase UbiE